MNERFDASTKTGTRSRGEFTFHVRHRATRERSICRFPAKGTTRAAGREIPSFPILGNRKLSSAHGLERFFSEGGGREFRVGPETDALGVGFYDVNESAVKPLGNLHISRACVTYGCALLMQTVPAISPSPRERDDRGILRHFDLTEGYLVSLYACVYVCVYVCMYVYVCAARVCGRCVGRLVYRACHFDTRGDGNGDGGSGDGGGGGGGKRNTLLIPSSRFRQIRAFHLGETREERGEEDLDSALRSPPAPAG